MEVCTECKPNTEWATKAALQMHVLRKHRGMGRGGKKRKLSPETRAKMSLAQKKRWGTGDRFSWRNGKATRKRKGLPVPDLVQAILAMEVKRDSYTAVINELRAMLSGGNV